MHVTDLNLIDMLRLGGPRPRDVLTSELEDQIKYVCIRKSPDVIIADWFIKYFMFCRHSYATGVGGNL